MIVQKQKSFLMSNNFIIICKFVYSVLVLKDKRNFCLKHIKI